MQSWLRTVRGRFHRLGPATTEAGQTEGRLSHFLPPKVPTLRARKLALKELTADPVSK